MKKIMTWSGYNPKVIIVSQEALNLIPEDKPLFMANIKKIKPFSEIA